MKYLFFARHFTYLRNFDSVLRALAERGHRVHVASERDEVFGGREMIDRLTREYPGITAGSAPERADGWYRIATKLRLTLDYLRYLEPAYETTPRLRTRAEVRVPRLLLWVLRLPVFRGARGRRRLARLLLGWERAIPYDPGVLCYIREACPDVVLITPLIGVVASPQLDYLYSAQALGIPTALCVWSWDHLSSKALIRTLPDRVLVWNPTQRQEAIELHGVPPDRVVVTGAQCFDQWFDRRPRRDRASFCRRVGLLDARPFLLWVCSALFRGSPEEASLVRRWIRTLRQSGHAALRDVNVLIRPHPSRMKEWKDIDLSQWDRVALWGGNPVDADTRDDYFDSLHHSAAVVGLNTSAFIEAAIVGRPVYTVLLPEFRENQEGTIHFHYLLSVAGGLLNASRTLDEHAARLGELLDGRGPDPERGRRFVEAFVRPQGLSRASTPLFVDSVEDLAQGRAVAPAGSAVTSPVPPFPVRLLAAFERGAGHSLMRDARERLEDARNRTSAARKERDRSVRLSAKAASRIAKARKLELRHREKQQILDDRKRRNWKKLLRARLGLG
ncbi:MAG: hypothetical protein HYX77_04225 [Acidobacteria bacterium]|nr:hypothetical protein [Acidobacteriota bacterium]